ncbi:MAG: response regulator transcription factor [Candidatus Obscuribacterales bacterium]|nr:response regulator transcription factor [Candidatus Obscuribacterales bacterium]
MAKILVADDEKDLRNAMVIALESQNFLVDSAADGVAALDLLSVSDYDVIVLDWDMPGATGPEICRKYRSSGGKAAVIILTGKRSVEEKEEGLDSGADDFLTKPIHHRELFARVRSALRRSSSFSDVLEADDLVLDPARHSCRRGELEIELLPKEFALLEFFMRHPDTVFSPEALLERVWPTDSETSPDMIRKYVSKLRDKVDSKDKPSLIRTVHGVGYRFQKK